MNWRKKICIIENSRNNISARYFRGSVHCLIILLEDYIALASSSAIVLSLCKVRDGILHCIWWYCFLHPPTTRHSVSVLSSWYYVPLWHWHHTASVYDGAPYVHPAEPQNKTAFISACTSFRLSLSNMCSDKRHSVRRLYCYCIPSFNHINVKNTSSIVSSYHTFLRSLIKSILSQFSTVSAKLTSFKSV